MNPNQPTPSETRNLMIAIAIGLVFMTGWQYFYEMPLRARQAELAKQKRIEEVQTAPDAAAPTAGLAPPAVTRADVLAAKASEKLPISSPKLHGSLSLKGGRIDDLTLATYHETLDKSSPEVVLLSPSATAESYFAEFGWLPSDTSTEVPGPETLWSADATKLAPDAPVTLNWVSPQGVAFSKQVSLDDQYLFTMRMEVKNTSTQPVTLYPYGRIQRNFNDDHKHFFILHEGPLGAFNSTLAEVNYKDLREEGAQSFDSKGGWIGFTDKYWLAALLPDDSQTYSAKMQYLRNAQSNEKLGVYQTDMRGQAVTIAPGESFSLTHRLFAGAKVVSVLDDYRARYNIPLFDRAVDFGMLYFLTKPIFTVLDFLFGFVGNFGIAILLLTVFIKALMYPLANKSYTAMSQMKVLMPKIKDLQERHKDDKMKMNTELMNLYKTEKVNPMSGCFPLLIQIPVFFALYKVLFVTIEMRHAPFYGWINDLSAPDPTNVFTLFGLIPWDAPTALHIGIWPLIMCVTMVLQQRLNPKPTDPVQAKVIAYMPYVFLFMFAKFPAGLVIYWAWNNTLSILQQRVILHRVERKKALTGHVS